MKRSNGLKQRGFIKLLLLILINITLVSCNLKCLVDQCKVCKDQTTYTCTQCESGYYLRNLYASEKNKPYNDCWSYKKLWWGILASLLLLLSYCLCCYLCFKNGIKKGRLMNGNMTRTSSQQKSPKKSDSYDDRSPGKRQETTGRLITEGPTTARSYHKESPTIVNQNPPRYESPRIIKQANPHVSYISPNNRTTYVSGIQNSPSRIVQVGAPQIVNMPQSPRRVFTNTSTIQANLQPGGGLTNVRVYTSNHSPLPVNGQQQQPQPVYSPQRQIAVSRVL